MKNVCVAETMVDGRWHWLALKSSPRVSLFLMALLASLLFGRLAPGAMAQGDPSLPKDMKLVRDVHYGEVSPAQRLDILYRPDAAEPQPAIVHIHGGGWYTGDKGGPITLDMMRRFVEAGYVAVSINYRLSDEMRFPAAVEDCKLALRWLRLHASDYCVDPERIGVIGGSAGGHLSTMLAVTRPEDGLEGGGWAGESSAVQAAVAVCAPMDLREPLTPPPAEEPDPVVVRFLGSAAVVNADAARRASPISYVRKDLPPILLIHGTDDKRVDPGQSKAMASALNAAGAPCELMLVAGGKHGMGIARMDETFARILAFFGRYLQTSRRPAAPVAPAESVRRWQDAKFGLFVHWGPASLTGGEISWSRAGERRGLPALPPGNVPVAEYDNLYQRFNPAAFDAAKWVSIAKAAGMRYMVFTAKHHDGFCMFNSALTDYDIAASPFKRDIVAELAKACREGGLGFGIYYSLPDWRHPDYLGDSHRRYVEYLHGQIRELCSNYGRIDVLWFDGGGQDAPDTWNSAELLSMIRNLQHDILINDRIPGATDFKTPEQVVGRLQLDEPWESCITLGQQWSWKPDDDLKSPEECIRLLVRCAGGGGNMLLNVGPMPSGEMEPRQVKRLKKVGAWLREYGDAIYGTRGGPYEPSYWGVSTRRENKVYVHIFEGWENSLSLPPIERRIVSSRLLGGGKVRVTQSPEGITIAQPPSNRRRPVSTVELTLDGLADTIPAKPACVGMPAGATAASSNVRRGEAKYASGKAVDHDGMSRWATDDGIRQAWLEIHLPEPITFDVIMIDEAFGNRIRAFELKARNGDVWHTFYTGKTVGRNWAGRFNAVTVQDLRLEIIKASDGPTIRDIQFHFAER